MFHYYFTVGFVIMHGCLVMSQNCAVPGRYCIDDYACCGGCCRNNICIQTYESCLVREDPCLRHYCPPGLECHVYQPNCIGCEPVTGCKVQKRYAKEKKARITKPSQTIPFVRNI